MVAAQKRRAAGEKSKTRPAPSSSTSISTTAAPRAGKAAAPPAPQERTGIGKAPAAKAVQKRKAVDDDDGDEEEHDDTGDILQPAILQETTRQVSRAEFRKWAHPTEKMLAEVEGIFQAAERPAMMAFRSDATRTVAQQSVQRIVSKLRAQVKKTPVPNVGKDIPLSYEGLIHKTAELEAVLEPTINYNADLELELEREKARLATDEARLAQLQTNAKSQERARAEQLRMFPRTLRTDPKGRHDSADVVGSGLSSRLQGAASYNPKTDREILGITAQLHQHLQSMQANSSGLGEVPDSIERGQEAVEEVLLRGGARMSGKVMGV